MVILDVRLHSVNDGCSPFNDEILKPVLLVQVSVHVLLQRLFAHPVFLALFVELDLLSIDISDCVLELLLC